MNRHPVRPDARCPVENEPADQIRAPRRETSREAANQRVGDERGPIETRLQDDAVDPAGERVDVQIRCRCRLAEPGDVGHNHVIRQGELGEHRRPHCATTLDPPVEEDQRWTISELDDGRGQAIHLEHSGCRRNSCEHPFSWICRLHGRNDARTRSLRASAESTTVRPRRTGEFGPRRRSGHVSPVRRTGTRRTTHDRDDEMWAIVRALRLRIGPRSTG